MQKKSSKSLFINVRSLTFCAMLVSLSVILGWVGRTYFTFGGGISAVRITFENLPVIASGFIFGPVVGGIVGIICDLVSCLVAPQPSINPFITLGTGLVGAISGFLFRYAFKGKKKLLPIISSDLFFCTSFISLEDSNDVNVGPSDTAPWISDAVFLSLNIFKL